MSDTSNTTENAGRQAEAAAQRAKREVKDGARKVAMQTRSTGRKVRREARAIEDSVTRGAQNLAADVGQRLRSYGVDTDRVADVAREQVSDLQRMVEDEIRERPLRALGLAAAVGLFVGFLSAR